MLQINTLTRLDLGVKQENLARDLYIDMSAWIAEYPNGSITVWHKRNGDETKYAVSGATFDRDSNVLTWTPTAYDTFYQGQGLAEIRLTENDVIKKTKDIVTETAKSLMLGSGETLEAGWQNLIDTMAGYASDAQDAADDAEDAKDAAEDAQEAAELAQDAAEDAQEAAETAQGKAEDAQEAAESAQNAAEYAQGKAEDAQEAAEAAQNAAEDAQGKAEDAQTAAETAQGKAEDAQEAAEAAQSAAETAAGHYPYIDETTGNWMVWDAEESEYVDTEVHAQGDPGTDGQDGEDGEDGVSAYVHIKYAAAQPTSDNDMKDTADAWMGIYSGDSATAPTSYTSYTWYNIKGATGQTGQTGATGQTGPAGASAYVHIRYSATEPTSDSDMKTTADAWMGIYAGSSSSAPTTYTSYTWYQIKGEQGSTGATGQTGPAGADGQDGADGTSAYVHIKWAGIEPTSDDDMRDLPSDWMGIYSGSSSTAPAHYTDYEWTCVKGMTGETGASTMTYIKYSATEPSSDSDMKDTPDAWMGVCIAAPAVVQNNERSVNPAPSHYTDYTWYQIKGSTGSTGANGTTFTPSVSNAGVISWTNDGGAQNPSSVDIVAAVISALPTAVGVSF